MLPGAAADHQYSHQPTPISPTARHFGNFRTETRARKSFSQPRVLALYKLYSHSMVEGGLELMSYTTRLTPGTSLTMRLEMRASTS